MRNLNYISLLLYLIVISKCKPVPRQLEPQWLVSEVNRVKRQAGYVYDKPSVSFGLPNRVPTPTVSTQAPTVDRTQAQMMYYAYPAPAAAGSNAANIGTSSGAASSGGGTGSTATSTSGGYNYAAQNTASMGADGSFQSSTGAAQSSTGGSIGYGYNVPTSAGAGSLSNGYQTSDVGSVQVVNGGSPQTASGSASGYAYNAPANTQSGTSLTVDVSTNAPQYLPPQSSAGVSNDISIATVSTATGNGGISSGSESTTKPLDEYLPPKPQSVSNPSGGSVNAGVQSSTYSMTQSQSANYLPPAPTPNRALSPVGNTCVQPPCSTSLPVTNANTKPLDQYLPPKPQSVSNPSFVSGGSVNAGVQSSTDSVTQSQSANYLPPARTPNRALSPVGNTCVQPPCPSSLPVTNATPRPFSPAPPATGYLPPSLNSQTPSQNSLSTPAPSYLPPVF